MGGAEMNNSKARAMILMTAILLVILAFPSKLHARQIQDHQLQIQDHQLKSISLAAHDRLRGNHGWTRIFERDRDRTGESLLDRDIRVRAATALIGDPVVKKSSQGAHVPLTILVITAPVILDV
jgi:hypothetical protein